MKIHGIKWGSEKQGGTRVRLSDAGWKEPLKWNRAASHFWCGSNCELDVEGNIVKQCESCRAKRPRVFCASLADVFEEWNGAIVDHNGEQLFHCNFGYCTSSEATHAGQLDNPCTMDDLRADLFRLIDATPNLDWLLLTKRPENIRRMWAETHEPAILHTFTRDAKEAYGATPPEGSPIDLVIGNKRRDNVWLGTSCSDQKTFDTAWRELAKCTELAPVRFFSLEPLIGPIDMHEALYVGEEGGHEYVGSRRNFFQLAIVGGESGPKARRCEVDWIRDIVAQCKAAEVACFVKQVGAKPVWPIVKTQTAVDDFADVPEWGELRDPKGGDMDEWPEDLRVREMPTEV